MRAIFNIFKSCCRKTQLPLNVTQESMKVHNLLSMLHLLAKHTKGKKPLIVVINSKYLDILRRKVMEKNNHKGIQSRQKKRKRRREVNE